MMLVLLLLLWLKNNNNNSSNTSISTSNLNINNNSSSSSFSSSSSSFTSSSRSKLLWPSSFTTSSKLVTQQCKGTPQQWGHHLCSSTWRCLCLRTNSYRGGQRKKVEGVESLLARPQLSPCEHTLGARMKGSRIAELL